MAPISILIILLIVLEITMSIYLIVESSKPKVTNVCTLGGSCNSVQTSPYGKIFGIKLPYLSLVAFIILLALFFISKKLFLAGAIAGGLFSLYLIIVQLLILKQICPNCMIVDTTMIIIAVLSFFVK